MPENDYEKNSPEHKATKYFTGPSIPKGSSHIHSILLGGIRDAEYTFMNPGSYEIGEDDDIGQSTFYEIGQSTFYEIGHEEIGAFSRSFDLNPPRLTGKINYYVKKGKLVTCAEIYIPASDTCLLFSIQTPMEPIIKALKDAESRGYTMPQTAALFGLDDSDFYEIGWGFRKALRRGSKHLRKTAKKVSKKISKKAIAQIVQSKRFKRYAKKISAAE